MAFDPSGMPGAPVQPPMGPLPPGLLGPGAPQPPASMPPPPPPKWHDVTVRRKRLVERCIIAPVPPEEFGISRFARNIKDCGYCFHEVIKRESDLIEQGYDEDQVHNLNTYSAMTNQEELARDTVEERQGTAGDSGLNRANREVKITEHYIKLDYEGNGKPTMYRITTGGDPAQILKKKVEGTKNKYAEEIVKSNGPPPFAAITPIPMPHRFFGRSIADVVMDIQRIKTVLLRGALDNLYLQNNPWVEVPETHAGPSTVDDLITRRPSGVVRTKAPGGILPAKLPDISQAVYPMLQYQDAQREWRSGASLQGQGVDGNSLQNQVATIANQMQDASQAKIKLIARLFAETGVKDLFGLVHSTLRKHGTQKQTVRLRGKFVEVDPREWKSRDDMTINVGLGNGDRMRRLAELQIMIQAQKDSVAAGMVSKRNLWNSQQELTKLVFPGHDAASYFCDPTVPPNPQDPASAPLPPPQDAKHAAVQAQAVEGQQKLQIEQAKAQHDISTKQMQMALEDKQAQADIVAQQAKTQAEAALQAQRFEFEKQIEFMRHGLEEQKHAAQMRRDDEMHQMNIRHTQEAHQTKLKTMAKPRAKA